jgi:hypothetical protein
MTRKKGDWVQAHDGRSGWYDAKIAGVRGEGEWTARSAARPLPRLANKSLDQLELRPALGLEAVTTVFFDGFGYSRASHLTEIQR